MGGAPSCDHLGPGWVWNGKSRRCVPGEVEDDKQVEWGDLWNWPHGAPTWPEWTLDLAEEEEEPTQCNAGEEWDGLQCVPKIGWVTVWCPDGTYARGQNAGDTSNCPQYEENLCPDGSAPNIFGQCPEDLEEECVCVPGLVPDIKLPGGTKTGLVNSCTGEPCKTKGPQQVSPGGFQTG